MILVYITCKDEAEAKKVSRHLLEKRLAACTNSFPVRSMYWWEGKVADEKEVVVLAKTRDLLYEPVRKEVARIHSYDVPCIMRIPVQANEPFEKWVHDETSDYSKGE
jgi:periplasmic divalent cation tolerance protein